MLQYQYQLGLMHIHIFCEKSSEPLHFPSRNRITKEYQEIFMNTVILYTALNEKSDLHFVRFNKINGNIFD